MRRAASLIAAVIVCLAVPAVGADYFQQFVHYNIDVKLDTRRHWVSGSETILYVNNSPDTLREFYMHLYPNAFRNKNVPYQRDKDRRYNYTLLDVPKDERGWLDLSDMHVDGDTTSVSVTGTIAHMKLPHALMPGDSMTLAFKFDGKVRKRADRSGYLGTHYDMAQWYPKVVVYDEKGFHPDQFETGEFYGEFGTFDVTIELPDNYVVVGTGLVTSGDPGWDYNPAHHPDAPKHKSTGNMKSVHFHAEKVHDFAWCADPTYVVQHTKWNGIDVYSAYRRSSASTWEDSTLAHAVRALRWLDKIVGPYGYPQCTVAEMLRGGGMEYPMFVMDGRASEGLAMHEIGHIYFYGMLGNNEREEAWLDEGFTTFQTRWYQQLHYGPWGDKKDWNWYRRMTPQYKLWEEYRHQVFDLDRRGYAERVSYRSEKYENSYRLNVYQKAALTLNTLKWVVGDENFIKILHTYYDRWKFKHVNEARFRAVCEEVTHRDLSRQFEQWLHTTKTVDYELASVQSRPDSAGVRTRSNINRLGELYCPIELVYTLGDGTVARKRMDARDRELRDTEQFPAAPKRVAINPDNEIMDRNLSNNFHPRKHDFQIDWPNNSYYPEDAYQIRHRPAIWYNDIDGAKVGYHVSGSLQGWSRRLSLGLYYGVESDRLDFSAAWEQPKRWFGTNATFRLAGYKMEGRAQGTFDIRFIEQKHLLEPPRQQFLIGYGYHELRDPRYLPSPEIYDTLQADVGPYFAYSVDPQIDVMSTHLDLGLRLGRKWFGGDYKYERFQASLAMQSRPEVVHVDARLRFFAGFSGGGTPTQRKFNLAGAGPVATGERFWLRSKGAVPEGLHYVEPGDGDLRGYFTGTFGVNKLMSMNAELGTRIKLLGLERPLSKLVGSMSWYGFYDAGSIMDKENPIKTSQRVQSLVDRGVLHATLQDAGIGIRSHVTWPFWNFTWRFDMPFWVNTPSVNGESDKTDFRYLFSIVAAI